MNKELIPINEIIKLNTRLYNNLLLGVTDGLASKKPGDKSNSMVYIIVHLLDTRFYIARFCGIKMKNPFKEIFDNASAFEELKNIPSLTEIIKVWNQLSEQLTKEIGNISGDRLMQNPHMDFPVEDKTILGAITFLTQHESYHMGQLGYLRKHFGLSPIEYN